MKYLFVILFLSSAAFAQDRAFGEKYRVLNERSMFSRTKIPPPKDYERPVATTPREPVRTNEPEFIFRGVSRANETSGYVALIEESTNLKTRRCNVGDMVGGSTITAIQLDALEVNRDGNPIRIDVGRTLRGDMPTAVADASSSTTQPTPDGGPAGPPPAPGSLEAKLAELKAKRMAEQQLLNR